MSTISRQNGAAWLILLLVLALGIAALLTSSPASQAIRLERDKLSDAALAQAKAALIGFAITYGDTHTGEVHGYLPCPDMAAGNPEGSAEAVCGSKNVSSLGRLPWRTLNLPLQRDGYGECLWYAVSGNYKNNPKTSMMNWDNNGLFDVIGADGAYLAGTDGASRAVAVIISPGMAKPNQDRSPSGSAPQCGGNYLASNYLDGNGVHSNSSVSSVANDISTFISAPSASVNDRLVYITKDEIFDALMRRTDFISRLSGLTQKTAECIAAFGAQNAYNGPENKSLPWAAPLILANYGANSSYRDAVNVYGGHVPYQVDTAKSASGNAIVGDILLNTTNCPPGWSDASAWWDNWKDHLFYALAKEYRPGNLPTPSCGECLTVNGNGPYAAVVLFAGRKLPYQERTDKGVPDDYLEGRNGFNIRNMTGNEDFESAPGSDTFNDILFCVGVSLAVMPCPP